MPRWTTSIRQTQAEKNAYLQEPIKCENCETTISRRSKARHLKCCKGYDYMLKKIDKEIEKETKLDEKINKLEDKISELKSLKKN
jgi:ribosomal protein L37AE/L43A